MPVALSVNLNKIALLRNSRTDNNPNIETFAELCLDAGANGLTAHPRPDQRHIRPSDIAILSGVAKKYGVEFNIEGNPFAAAQGEYPGLLALVERAMPEQCTLVPDSDTQLTSDHGFNLIADGEKLKPIIAKLRALNVRISLFMDPDLAQIQLAKDIGADRIELYTGPYAASAKISAQSQTTLEIFEAHKNAAEFAQSIGLGINAGHDLNLDNLTQYCQINGLQEVSIGHALTADALLMGFKNAVKAYADICHKA